jgi:excisionase family DNA binding protein
MEESRTYTVAEAAALLGVSPRHLFDTIRAGKLPAIRLGRTLRLPKAMVTRMIDEPGWQPPVAGTETPATQQPAPLTAIRGRRTSAKRNTGLSGSETSRRVAR